MSLALPLWIKVVGALAALRLVIRRRAPSIPLAPPPPDPPAPTIRLGSRGPAVAFWRYVVGTGAGDTFDQPTDTATRAWQTAHGLGADGIVGPATWRSVGISGSAPLPHAPPSPPAPGPAPGPIGPPPPPVSPPPVAAGAAPFGLASNIQEREGQILAHVSAGHIDHDWHPISWEKGGHVVSMLVSRRPLALDDGSQRLVVSTTYPTAQTIGDMIGGSMLTTRIADEIHRQAPVSIAPMTRPWSTDNTMSHTDRMAQQSAALDHAAAQAGDDGAKLVDNLGKDWVLTRRNWLPPAGTGVEKPAGQSGSRHNGANFGWYLAGSGSHSPGGEPVIQSVGLAHDFGHTDYSQLLRFVKSDSITIDGAPVSYSAALADPSFSALLQDEGGTLPSDRHPDL